MTRKVQWNSDALPYDQTLDQVLYEIRRSDAGESLLLDAVSAKDIIEDADGALAFDALVTPYAKLERKMEVLQGVMVRSGESVKPVAMQVTEPFKQRGVANVAAIFELSDGQTVSIFFHNPDVTPNKMAASDEVISWKWLLNKKDITIVVAPERGEDLNIREVARRIIRLAEKNSPAFQRANSKRAERMQGIQSLKDEIAALEKELATAQHELEVAKVSAETAPVRTLLTDEEQATLTNRTEAARAILEGMTDEQITKVGASPSLVSIVTQKRGRFVAIDKILENHPDDVESAIASVSKAVAATSAQNPDITYRNSTDGLFTSFFPNTPEGEKAWNIINATPGAEGGKVLASHAESTIVQLRDAGYTVAEDTSGPTTAEEADALAAALEDPPQPDEQALIDAYFKSWGEEAAQINAAVAAINWEGITDTASAAAEMQKLQSAANGERPIIKARDALEAAGMKMWDSRLPGVTETEEFKAQSKAMDDYREAMDKIQAIAKEKLIEAGKAELAALPEDAPLEDAARAIYRKHGIDMGQRSDWVSRVVTAIKEKDAEALRSILAGVGSDRNKASMEVFERATGVKLAKTQRERGRQIDEWAGITPEKRAEMDAAKDAAWLARQRESKVKDAWDALKAMNVRNNGTGIVSDGQQYLLRQFNDGYDEAGTSKKGAATIYGMKKGSGLRFVNNRSFNAFLKSAMAFGGLRKALESVGAIEPIGNADGGYTVAEDASEPISAEEEAALLAELGKTATPAVDVQNEPKSEDVIELSGNELGEFPDTEEGKKALRNAAIKFYEDNLMTLDGVVNIALDHLIEFDGRGKGKIKSFSADPRKLHVVAKLESIVRNGRPTPISPMQPHAMAASRKVKLVHVLKTPVQLDGKAVKVRFLVHEMADGHFFYDHSIDRDELRGALGRSSGVLDSADAADLWPSVLLPDEPSSGQRSLDSVAKSGKVFNLFFEGEEPEEIADESDEDGGNLAHIESIIASTDGAAKVRYEAGGKVYISAAGDGKQGEMRYVLFYYKGSKGEFLKSYRHGNGLLSDAFLANVQKVEKAFSEAGIAVVDKEGNITMAPSQPEANATTKEEKSEATEGPAKDRMAALKMLTDTGMNVWMSEGQNKAVIAGLMGEEWKFFADKMKELSSVIGGMPKTYDQDGMGDAAVAHLHYFRGAADWYITEKDMEGKGTEQAFGLADLGYGGELGYISIDELIRAGVELDFHFAPKTVGQIKGKSEAGAPESQEKAPEVSPEDQQKQADQALFQSVIDGSIQDILAPELADSLEAAYYRQQTDPALVSLFEQAVSAYQNAMMSATAELA